MSEGPRLKHRFSGYNTEWEISANKFDCNSAFQVVQGLPKKPFSRVVINRDVGSIDLPVGTSAKLAGLVVAHLAHFDEEALLCVLKKIENKGK